MSVAGWLDAMHSDYPPAHRLVWMCLESHANAARCWQITDEALADELHISTDTVSRALLVLEADEVIEVERRKRRASRYRMLRTYKPAGKSGQDTYDDDELTPQNADSTEDLTPQIAELTAAPAPELTPHAADSTPELTPQKAETLESNRKNPTERKKPPLTPPQAGGVVVQLKRFEINPNEETRAHAERLDLDADNVALAVRRAHDRLITDRQRTRCLDPQAVIRRQMDAVYWADRRGGGNRYLRKMCAAGESLEELQALAREERLERERLERERLTAGAVS